MADRPLTAAELAELDRLANAATPGPWESVTIMPAGTAYSPSGEPLASWSESPWRIVNGPPQTVSDDMESRRAFTHAPDAAFIAAARQAVPALLADLAEARRERDEAKALQREQEAEVLGERLSNEQHREEKANLRLRIAAVDRERVKDKAEQERRYLSAKGTLEGFERELAKLRASLAARDRRIQELEKALGIRAPHEHVFVHRPLGDHNGSRKCSICGERDGWWCPDSPDNRCEYPKRSEWCKWCHEPTERK